MHTTNATNTLHNDDAIESIINTNVKISTPENETPPPADTLDEPFKNVEPATTYKPMPRDTQTQYPVVGENMNMVTPLERLGEEATFIDCPHCEKRTKTKVEKHDSSQTEIAAAVCCLFCGIITVCIPSLCGWCADIDHCCSECGKTVSHKPHDGPVQARYPQEPVQTPSKYIGKS